MTADEQQKPNAEVPLASEADAPPGDSRLEAAPAPNAAKAPPLWPIMAGMVAIALGFAILSPPWPIETETGGHAALISRVKSDMRSLAEALEKYYVDCNSYPAWATGDSGANAYLPKGSPSYRFPTFRTRRADEYFFTLTTPIAYLTNYFEDVFSDPIGASYGYYSQKCGWILVSPGLDGKFDINPPADYDSHITQPSLHLMLLSYDPTNGTDSSGDIWRVKQ